MTEGVIFLWFIMTGETILLLHRNRKMPKKSFYYRCFAKSPPNKISSIEKEMVRNATSKIKEESALSAMDVDEWRRFCVQITLEHKKT